MANSCLPLAAALMAMGTLAQATWPAQDRQRTTLRGPDPDPRHSIAVLREWAAAVEQHAPGEADAQLRWVAAWSRDHQQAAWIDVQALLAVVQNRDATTFSAQPSGRQLVLRDFLSEDDVETLRQLAARVRRISDRFVKRAAVLHGDVGRHMNLERIPPPPSSGFAPQRFVLETSDGRQDHVRSGVIHWEFGRLLLAHVAGARRDEFVRDWYRASMAFKLAIEDLDVTHFARAVAVLPSDPTIRVLKGALHDALAHPATQFAVEAAQLPHGLVWDVRSEAAELRDAEREFRRAVGLDPAFAEARLRLGRVLARQGKHTEAASELRQALAQTREPQLDYYARLFLAAEEEALGRSGDARTLYEEAAKLYPQAQAPRLALSQLAHRGGDRAAARAALDTAIEPSTVRRPDDDPWWVYQRSAGRQANEWREASYRLLQR
jgi:tetratricopeptide (TPR) repeat protein